MTVEEKVNAAFDLSADLFNAIADIPAAYQHPCDLQEFVRDIHDIQNRIISIAYKHKIELKSTLR